MYSNPNHLYQMLYGGISTGDIRRQHEARSNMLNQIEKLAATKGRSLPTTEQQRYGQFVQGFKDVNGLRDRLDTVADHLRKFAPKVDERYTKPEFETDWHDVLLDLGISALTSGITNTLTIGSGRGEIFGAWKGLGIEQQGHNLGHHEAARQSDLDQNPAVQQSHARADHGSDGKRAGRQRHHDGQYADCLHQQ